jgi:heptosyltransferase I
MPRSKSHPQRVLICRLSAIGDCIHTLPLAVKIKELWPDCKLTWVVGCAAAQLLQPHSAIDELIKVERHWVKNSKLWSSLRTEFRQRQFDVAFDPQGLIKSGLLAWLSGAAIRVGFDYSQARELAPLMVNRRVRRTQRHMVDTYLELLTPWITLQPGQASFNMPVYTAASARVPELLAASGIESHEDYVCITPGAGWPTKIWPTERFSTVASHLSRFHKLRSLIVWAGEGERLMANAIAEHSGDAAVVAPPTSLTELAELSRGAKLFLGADTGPLHLAAAIGTPCVGLYGPTWGDEVGPYCKTATESTNLQSHLAIQSTHLPVGRRGMRRGTDAAMRAIDIEEVTDACDRLLANRRQRAVA